MGFSCHCWCCLVLNEMVWSIHSLHWLHFLGGLTWFSEFLVQWVSESVRTQVDKGSTHIFIFVFVSICSSVHSFFRCWFSFCSLDTWLSPVAPQLATALYHALLQNTTISTIIIYRTIANTFNLQIFSNVCTAFNLQSDFTRLMSRWCALQTV